MADCIDRQALYEAIRQLADETECNIAVLPDMAEKIREAPAADVAPVVHGRWENGCVCSNCTTHCGPKNKTAVMYYRYCPFCGAKMDLEAT